jgi:hypothetical protein
MNKTNCPSFFRLILLLVAFAFLFCGCATKIPKEALQLSKESLQNRQMQTRRFDADEKTLLSASAAVLQDLGFNIDESETDLGVIVCSKQRDAKSAGQIAGAVFLALLTGVATPVDKEQLIRVSLVTHPIEVEEFKVQIQGEELKTQEEQEQTKQTAVRITFQRVVINTQGQITKQECINKAEIYQEFFDKLSQSLFLEAHEI